MFQVLLLLFIIIVSIIILVAASSWSAYIYTTNPKTGLPINRYPKSLSITNNTGSEKTFHISHNGTGGVYWVQNGETLKYGVNPEGIKSMKISSYDDLVVGFTFPCISDSCSSSDVIASCKADISKSYKSSLRLNTYENKKKVFTADLFVAGNCPDNLLRDSTCFSPEDESVESDIMFYEEMKSTIKEINIPYTDKTVYELVYY